MYIGGLSIQKTCSPRTKFAIMQEDLNFRPNPNSDEGAKGSGDGKGCETTISCFNNTNVIQFHRYKELNQNPTSKESSISSSPGDFICSDA